MGGGVKVSVKFLRLKQLLIINVISVNNGQIRRTDLRFLGALLGALLGEKMLFPLHAGELGGANPRVLMHRPAPQAEASQALSSQALSSQALATEDLRVFRFQQATEPLTTLKLWQWEPPAENPQWRSWYLKRELSFLPLEVRKDHSVQGNFRPHLRGFQSETQAYVRQSSCGGTGTGTRGAGEPQGGGAWQGGFRKLEEFSCVARPTLQEAMWSTEEGAQFALHQAQTRYKRLVENHWILLKQRLQMSSGITPQQAKAAGASLMAQWRAQLEAQWRQELQALRLEEWQFYQSQALQAGICPKKQGGIPAQATLADSAPPTAVAGQEWGGTAAATSQESSPRSSLWEWGWRDSGDGCGDGCDHFRPPSATTTGVGGGKQTTPLQPQVPRLLVQAPAKLWQGQWSVQLRMNWQGRKVRGYFLLDAGVAQSKVSPDWLQKNGIPLQRQQAPVGFLPQLSLQGMELPSLPFLITPATKFFEPPQFVGSCCDGVLGVDFLSRYPMEFFAGKSSAWLKIWSKEGFPGWIAEGSKEPQSQQRSSQKQAWGDGLAGFFWLPLVQTADHQLVHPAWGVVKIGLPLWSLAADSPSASAFFALPGTQNAQEAQDGGESRHRAGLRSVRGSVGVGRSRRVTSSHFWLLAGLGRLGLAVEQEEEVGGGTKATAGAGATGMQQQRLVFAQAGQATPWGEGTVEDTARDELPALAFEWANQRLLLSAASSETAEPKGGERVLKVLGWLASGQASGSERLASQDRLEPGPGGVSGPAAVPRPAGSLSERMRQAGVRVGDEILEVNGQSAADFDLWEIEQRLLQRPLRLKWQRRKQGEVPQGGATATAQELQLP